MSWILGLVIIIIGVAIAIFVLSAANTRRGNRRDRHPILRDLADWYRRTAEDARCAPLRKELLKLARSQQRAERLISLEKLRNPGKPESWYLEKVIYDFKRGR